jgi:hypothetical protein
MLFWIQTKFYSKKKKKKLKSYVDYNASFVFKILSEVCRWPGFIYAGIFRHMGEFCCFVFVSKLEAFIIMPRNCTKMSIKGAVKIVANELRCCGLHSGRSAVLVDIQTTHWICANARSIDGPGGVGHWELDLNWRSRLEDRKVRRQRLAILLNVKL